MLGGTFSPGVLIGESRAGTATIDIALFGKRVPTSGRGKFPRIQAGRSRN